jgi:hypothetical protein
MNRLTSLYLGVLFATLACASADMQWWLAILFGTTVAGTLYFLRDPL